MVKRVESWRLRSQPFQVEMTCKQWPTSHCLHRYDQVYFLDSIESIKQPSFESPVWDFLATLGRSYFALVPTSYKLWFVAVRCIYHSTRFVFALAQHAAYRVTIPCLPVHIHRMWWSSSTPEQIFGIHVFYSGHKCNAIALTSFFEAHCCTRRHALSSQMSAHR